MIRLVPYLKLKIKYISLHRFFVLQNYFFDPYKMTDGQPPNDRGCRACGKIGHLVRDCPKKKASDDHKKARKEEKAGNKKNTATPTAEKGGAEASKGVKRQDSKENRSSEETLRSPTAKAPPVSLASTPAATGVAAAADNSSTEGNLFLIFKTKISSKGRDGGNL